MVFLCWTSWHCGQDADLGPAWSPPCTVGLGVAMLLPMIVPYLPSSRLLKSLIEGRKVVSKFYGRAVPVRGHCGPAEQPS